VVAGSTVARATVAAISRRHASSRFAGSRSFSMSAGSMTLRGPLGPQVGALVERPVAHLPELGEPLDGRSLALEAGERADRGVKRGLRPLDPLVRLADPLLVGGAAAGVGEMLAHPVHDDLLGLVGLDPRLPRAPARARVAAPIAAAPAVHHHQRPAPAAAQHPEPREQPLGVGLPAARHPPALHPLEQVPGP
jgi:hypothetical protein